MIRIHIDGPVATVTLARPEKKNALTLAMRQELEALPSTLGADPSVRVVVLTGAGGCFSAGADLREIADHGLGVDLAEAVRHEKEIAVHHRTDDPETHLGQR